MKYLIAIVAVAAIVKADDLIAAYNKPIAILRQAQDQSPEGSYAYSFETENGIARYENGSPIVQGETGPVVASQGSYQYTAPDGTPIRVDYTADEYGFHPSGAHLPVAPPVPEAIARALEYIRTHPQPEYQPEAQKVRKTFQGSSF